MLTPQSHEATVEQYAQLQAPPAAGFSSHATPSLEGIVKDPSGAMVSGARVSVRNEETGVSQVTTTDARGHYRFNDLQSWELGALRECSWIPAFRSDERLSRHWPHQPNRCLIEYWICQRDSRSKCGRGNRRNFGSCGFITRGKTRLYGGRQVSRRFLRIQTQPEDYHRQKSVRA